MPETESEDDDEVISIRPRSDPEKRMWFGKYAGMPLRELPDRYIQWCRENLNEERYGDLLDSMEKAVEGREDYIPDEYEESGRDLPWSDDYY